MQIRYTDGKVLNGIMLTLSGSMARIAIKGDDDVAEFRLVHGQWISEDCEPVAFEYPLTMFPSKEAPAPKPAPRLPESAAIPAAQFVN